jgi:hypothetical protein
VRDEALLEGDGHEGLRVQEHGRAARGDHEREAQDGRIDGNAKVQAVGKGDPLPLPSLPLTLPVTVQLVLQDGASKRCWQTTYTTNKALLFNAKGP